MVFFCRGFLPEVARISLVTLTNHRRLQWMWVHKSYVLWLSSARHYSQDLPQDAGFLYGTTVVLGAARQKKHSVACVPTTLILGGKLGQNRAVRRCRRGWGIYQHGQTENIHWSHLAQERFYENCNEHSSCIKVKPFGDQLSGHLVTSWVAFCDQLSGHLVTSWVAIWWPAEWPFVEELSGRLVTS